ncbi:hypothetical protein O1Q96_02440 [Streptomyces sp. Qhu-G9]|uniref:SCO2400 family protein n=1 Tax=Streptomyces sp. Qhu-G9 TaxID=3452799 RepID=UPI0022AC77FE|nr:hypothetical protein [Streptomyces aurantiacus]WAU78714.1 hypothetical protein O1Q96_02440 [Streptomyces aurantiacus]
MDYCSSCRRHLNGALVCPGCGAYAPDIAPGTAHATVGRPTVQPRVTMAAGSAAADAVAAWQPAASVPWQDGRPHEGATAGPDSDDAPEADPYGGFEGATPAPQGRAARRRQRIRWKKNQRRAVVATAVALVGGGLSFAALDRHSPDHAEAATAPEAPGPGSAAEEATQYTRPTAARPDARRSSSAPATQSPAKDRPHRRTAADPASLTPEGARSDAVPSAPTTPASDARSRTSSPPSDDTAGSAAQQPSAPATDGTDGTGGNSGTGGTSGSGGTGGTDSGAAQASPAPTATSPSQLCLLVVCIG